jgi:2-dehydropantoate 2-reductase
MQILVVGAGAVGGYFGARLAQAGRDVTFLVRPTSAERIKKNGIVIVSPHGDLTLRPKLLTAGDIREQYNVVLLAVKGYGLDEAIEDFSAAVGLDTMILPALNGMRHIDVLIRRFGKPAVIGGVCKVATELADDGRIRQLADFQSLTYGELDGQRTSRIEKLDSTMQAAGFDAELSDHIVGSMWQKWVQLSSLGATTCLLRGNIGEIVAVEGGADLAAAILGECAEVARACGYPTSEAFLAKHQADLTAPGSSLTSSMYRDLIKGASVEVDAILGDLLERGLKLGLKMPLLQAAFVCLSVNQRRHVRS